MNPMNTDPGRVFGQRKKTPITIPDEDIDEDELAEIKSVLDQTVAPEDQPFLVCVGNKAFFNFAK